MAEPFRVEVHGSPEARARVTPVIVAALRQFGARPVMVSGDRSPRLWLVPDEEPEGSS